MPAWPCCITGRRLPQSRLRATRSARKRRPWSEATALFAKDGVVELPHLLDLGMQWQYKGRTEIASLYALLLQLVPEWASRDTVVLIDSPERVFVNTRWKHSPSRRSGRSGSIFSPTSTSKPEKSSCYAKL
jgi:hypothetical protein